MKAKTKAITLSYPHYDLTKDTVKERAEAPRVYRVERITNSIEFAPLSDLSSKQADELCASRDWQVTIISPPAK